MKADQPHILVVDNYDSFTYNLVHLLQQLDVQIDVKRNDRFHLDEVAHYSHILISPGPGIPSEAGKVMEMIEAYSTTKPMLGVCLGMQAMLLHEGGNMVNMPSVQHGAKESIKVRSHAGLFEGLPETIDVGRYHSWAFTEENVPSSYEVTAVSNDGYVMAVAHRSLPLSGVQFHPESVMSDRGKSMLENWVR